MVLSAGKADYQSESVATQQHVANALQTAAIYCLKAKFSRQFPNQEGLVRQPYSSFSQLNKLHGLLTRSLQFTAGRRGSSLISVVFMQFTGGRRGSSLISVGFLQQGNL